MSFDPRRYQTATDEQLVEAICAQDDIAFQSLYQRHADAAYSLALYIVRSPGRAEDAVQEAFLAIWRTAPRFDPGRGPVRAWILGAVRHRSIDALRRAATQTRGESAAERMPEAVAEGALPPELAFRREDRKTIATALDRLPAEQSEVVRLAYFAGLTHTEIAKRLDLPLGTVKGRMRLALLKLRETLEDWREATR